MIEKYFAYGSNLSFYQMRERCGLLKSLGGATLENYQLSFSEYGSRWGGGSATISAKKGEKTEGIVYALKKEAVQKLDPWEIPPYKKIKISLAKYGEVFTYIKSLKYLLAPSTAYLIRILEGYEKHQLNIICLEKALQNSGYLGKAIFLLKNDPRKEILPAGIFSEESYLQKKEQSGRVYFFNLAKNNLLKTLKILLQYKETTQRLGFFKFANTQKIPAWYFE